MTRNGKPIGLPKPLVVSAVPSVQAQAPSSSAGALVREDSITRMFRNLDEGPVEVPAHVLGHEASYLSRTSSVEISGTLETIDSQELEASFSFDGDMKCLLPVPTEGDYALQLQNSVVRRDIEAITAHIDNHGGTYLNELNMDGQSPFLYALINAYEDVALLLLEKGADPWTHWGKEEYRQKHRILHLAAQLPGVEVMNELLETLPSTHPPLHERLDETNRTALHIAAEQGNFNLAKKIVEHSRQTRRTLIALRDNQGHTAVHLAALAAHSEIVEYLLQDWGDGLVTMVNSTDERGMTPLHHAASSGDIKSVQILIHAGVKLDTKAADDNVFAAVYAFVNNHRDVVMYLRDAWEGHLRIKSSSGELIRGETAGFGTIDRHNPNST